MATVRYAPILAIILIFLCHSVAANFTFPALPPLFGNACTENVCGKGKCLTSDNSTFGFECVCERGWKQARSDHDEFFRFLPCVIPNCSLNYSCAKAPAPAPDNQKKPNTSFFDPCFWTDCGGGSCNKTSLFSHNCVCEEGYNNLFNSTAFPCYKECAIGMDCASLGINVKNSSSGTSPSLADNSHNSQNHAGLIPKVEFGWLTTMMTTLVLLLWKNS